MSIIYKNKVTIVNIIEKQQGFNRQNPWWDLPHLLQIIKSEKERQSQIFVKRRTASICTLSMILLTNEK